MPAHDPIHNPVHYTRGTIEPQEFIRTNRMTWTEGNVVKYIIRHDAKGHGKEDLYRALQFLAWVIQDWKRAPEHDWPRPGLDVETFLEANPYLGDLEKDIIRGVYYGTSRTGPMALHGASQCLSRLITESA